MKKYKVTTKVNIRSGPGTDFEIEGQLEVGEIVQVIENLAGWLPVLVEDEDGAPSVAWASGKYLKLAGEDEVEEEITPPIPSKVVTGKQIVAKAMTQSGDPYIFGYEVSLKDSDPDAFDCSELVEWVCAQLGVTPKMPDGAAGQHDHCKRQGTLILISEAVRTPGALLFRITPEGNNHVAISMGTGATIEARGKAYGVGSWSASGRPWTAAAKIPGVKYA